MSGNSQTKSTEKWQKKAGYKVKSFKLKESLVNEFEKACSNAGVSQAVRPSVSNFENDEGVYKQKPVSIVKKYGKNLTGFCRCNSGNISGLVLTVILIKFVKSFGKLHIRQVLSTVRKEDLVNRK